MDFLFKEKMAILSFYGENHGFSSKEKNEDFSH